MTYGVSMRVEGQTSRRPRRRFRLSRGPNSVGRKWQSIRFLLTRDRGAVSAFLKRGFGAHQSVWARLQLLYRITKTTNAVRGYHTLGEMLEVIEAILERHHVDELRVVEVGAGSGASTAKLSLAVARVGGQLNVFDTFQGIPQNDEQHTLLDGRPLVFQAGAFRGRLGAVERRVRAYGVADGCAFYKGDIRETLKGYDEAVDVALLDVDLVDSTRAALEALVPNLRPGGVIFSQDGHLTETVRLLQDPQFLKRLGPVRVYGLGQDKLIRIERIL